VAIFDGAVHSFNLTIDPGLPWLVSRCSTSISAHRDLLAKSRSSFVPQDIARCKSCSVALPRDAAESQQLSASPSDAGPRRRPRSGLPSASPSSGAWASCCGVAEPIRCKSSAFASCWSPSLPGGEERGRGDSHSGHASRRYRRYRRCGLRCHAGLLAAPGFVVAGRGVHFQHPANPADRHAPTAANRVHQLAFTSRPHSFRRMASCSIFLSSERSATSLRSRILVLELLQPAHVRRQHPSYF